MNIDDKLFIREHDDDGYTKYTKVTIYDWRAYALRVELYKDIFFEDCGILIQVGSDWHRASIYDWLRMAKEYSERAHFPVRIGRLGLACENFSEYNGWRRLFWRLHWKEESK